MFSAYLLQHSLFFKSSGSLTQQKNFHPKARGRTIPVEINPLLQQIKHQTSFQFT